MDENTVPTGGAIPMGFHLQCRLDPTRLRSTQGSRQLLHPPKWQAECIIPPLLRLIIKVPTPMRRSRMEFNQKPERTQPRLRDPGPIGLQWQQRPLRQDVEEWLPALALLSQTTLHLGF